MLVRVAVGLLLIPLLHSCTSRQERDAEARRVLDSMMTELTRSAGALDSDRFMTFFARDSTLLIVFNGHAQTGWDSLRSTQRQYWATLARVRYDVQATRVTLLGPDMALGTSFGTIEEQPLTGVSRKGSYINTMVWHRRPEGWRVVQAHESTNP